VVQTYLTGTRDIVWVPPLVFPDLFAPLVFDVVRVFFCPELPFAVPYVEVVPRRTGE
jgi:hypothetical protein